MRIKKIEIQGFKSFSDRVVLELQDGITSVVGPNGCGKSNIIDAIRWAMGEQSAKNLRGQAMEDVICGGSESRKPSGMAEVSLTFANDGKLPPAYRDFDEIVVTRRLFRNGDSEYLINKAFCRLRDISELFMDTGVGARTYSIIEQGKIGMILHAKPEERRALIEEAAGVTKYKSRKKLALRKIDATRQNLLRLGDIISEVRRQLGRLKRAAQKAEEFRTYREEFRLIETRFALAQVDRLTVQIEQLEKDERNASLDLERNMATLQEAELRAEEGRLQLIEEERGVNLSQEQVFAVTGEIQQVEGRIDLNRKEQQSLILLRERQASETQEIDESIQRLEGERTFIADELLRVTADQGSRLRQLGESEGVLEELTGREQEVAERLEENRRAHISSLGEVSRLKSFVEEAGRRLDALILRLERRDRETLQLNEQLEQARTNEGSFRRVLDDLLARRGVVESDLEAAEDELGRLQRERGVTEEELRGLRERLSGESSRLSALRGLEESFAGYEGGIKKLLGAEAFRGRLQDSLAASFEVPQELEPVVEAALGARLQSPVVGDASTAQEAFAFLEHEGGRCTLIGQGGLTPGLISFPQGRALLDRVIVRPGAERAVQSMLAGIYLVDDLMKFWGEPLPAGVVLVTLRGETLDYRGLLGGGSSSSLDEGLLARKRRIRELEESVEAGREEQQRVELRLERLKSGIADTTELTAEMRRTVHSLDLQRVDAEKDFSRFGHEADRLMERLEVLALEGEQLFEERETIEQERQEAEATCLRSSELLRGREEESEQLAEELQLVKRDVQTVRERVTGLKVEVASAREREDSLRDNDRRIERMLADNLKRKSLLVSRLSEGENEEDRLKQEADRLHAMLDVLFSRRDEAKGAYEVQRARYEEGVRRISEQEAVLKGLRTGVAELKEREANLQLRLREQRMELDLVFRTFQARHQGELAEVELPDDPSFTLERGEQRIAQLTRLIDDLGEVNLTAIDEYRELEERFNFLSAQQEDLKNSMEDLQRAINKINRITRRRFREAFDQVNEKFQEVFPRLFRGGRAELLLTDDQDLLEAGIDIIAQPPGKKLQNVMLLSGGEKALTAVALIFAIFLIKPSPFCILDEVDAPLDDANIGRFNDMVREMSASSQFLIITHNKMTMEIADSLFGITMEEPGVSKTVSVRLN